MIVWVSRDPSAKGAFRIAVVAGGIGDVPRTLRASDRMAAETMLINLGASIPQALLTVAKASLKGDYSIAIDIGEEVVSAGVPKTALFR